MDETTLVRTFYEQAWNQWDDAVVDAILSQGFTFRGSLGDEVTGPDGWRAYRDKVREAVPDFHNEIVDLVTSPGRAAARLRYTGHQQGVLLGQPGRGQFIEYAGAAFFTCENGQLATAWVLGDLDSLRRQLAAAS
jgi:steroid delta-isomerase-like uncharacterized protein